MKEIHGNTKESEIKNKTKINGEILDLLEYFEKDSSQNELRFPRMHFSSGNTSIFICPTGLLILDSCGIQGLWVHSNGSNDWNFTPPLRGKARLFLDTAT